MAFGNQDDLRSYRPDTPAIDAMLDLPPGPATARRPASPRECTSSTFFDEDPGMEDYRRQQAHDDLLILTAAIVRCGASHVHTDGEIVARARQIRDAIARNEGRDETDPRAEDAAVAAYERYRVAGGGHGLAPVWEKLCSTEQRAWLEASARRRGAINSDGAPDVEAIASRVEAAFRNTFNDLAAGDEAARTRKAWLVATATALGPIGTHRDPSTPIG